MEHSKILKLFDSATQSKILDGKTRLFRSYDMKKFVLLNQEEKTLYITNKKALIVESHKADTFKIVNIIKNYELLVINQWQKFLEAEQRIIDSMGVEKQVIKKQDLSKSIKSLID